ncbi:hypothetical protein F5Y13DRAFT_193341 [Hypoxylon sp. FL1857]|nr:hypothetical protein F5Y13DRAFT_193341 [Hypoxylon sp. FL1857]
MRKLAKKRETAIQKHQRAVSLAAIQSRSTPAKAYDQDTERIQYHAISARYSVSSGRLAESNDKYGVYRRQCTSTENSKNEPKTTLNPSDMTTLSRTSKTLEGRPLGANTTF